MVGRLTPEEYIRRSCELHLQARISSTHRSSLEALNLFLQGGQANSKDESNSDSSTNRNPPRLFIWIPQNAKLTKLSRKSSPPDRQIDDDIDAEDEYVEALASTNTFHGTNFGALAFINSSMAVDSSATVSSGSAANAIKYAHQIQCMILCPRVYWTKDSEGNMDHTDPHLETTTSADDDISVKEGLNPESITFHSLQMYARHCFVPAVHAIESLEDEKKDEGFVGEGSLLEPKNAMGSKTRSSESLTSTDAAKVNRQKKKSRLLLEGLEDKLRELDLALGQCRRTTLGQIPQVVLHTHPVITNAASRIPSSGKIDLDEVGLSHLLSDDSFLNQVQTGVSTWISQIRKVTGLPSTTTFPSATNDDDDNDDVYMDLEEISFWNNLDMALKQIKSELSKPNVQLSIAILKAAKRFVATIALENNTGVDSAEAHINDVCNFLRPYPVSALVAARDFNKLAKVVENIFLQLPKVRQSRFYDLERCVRLLESSTLTLRKRMLLVLKAKGRNSKSHLITGMSYDEYEKEINYPCTQIFERFDVLFDDFTEFIVEQSRKRSGNKMAPVDLVHGICLHHKVLRERIQSLYFFRSQHEKLKHVVTEVLNAEKDSFAFYAGEGLVDFSAESAVREVEEAPMSVFSSVDVLDLSPKGQATFSAALGGYDRRVDVIEEKLASVLREKLMVCKDAEDMFQVFERFNPLLSRTRVNNAVKEFQMQLITTVGDSIQKLQSKFIHKFETSSANLMSQIRGIPPISGKILWAKLIERQVRALMKHMGSILGPNWGQHLEGRKLKRSCDDLLGKLDARSFFRAWVSDWEKEMRSDAVSSNARLNSYPIVVMHENATNLLVASVNFKESYELLFREIRQLKWLGFDRDIPRTLSSTADEAITRYPLAIALKSALRSYSAVRNLITPELEPLVVSNIKAIRESIEEGFSPTARVRWGSKDIREWIISLTELVALLEERVEILISASDKVHRCTRAIQEVTYSEKGFSELIQNIQKIIDELSLASYMNLDSWIDKINNKLYVALCTRLCSALEVWVSSTHPETSCQENKKEIGSDLPIDYTITVDVVLQNQEIVTSPSLPTVREMFLRSFHDLTGAICSLNVLHSKRYEIFGSSSRCPTSNKDFSEIMSTISPELITKSYQALENNMAQVSNVVSYFVGFQLLWDKSTIDISSMLGDDITRWQRFLRDLVETRSELESADTSIRIGAVTVRYEKVKVQISLKFDSWQRDSQILFANILRRKIAELFDELQCVREKLETVHLDGSSSSTQEVINGLTYLQEVNGKIAFWQTFIEQITDGERVLRRQRYSFPWDWVESSRLKGQYLAIEQILFKRLQSVEDNRSILQTRVTTEAKVASLRMADLTSSWESGKPTKATVTPCEALETIATFELGMKKAQRDEENLIKAKDALGLDSSVRNIFIIECLAELSDIKEVWQYISKPHGLLQEIKDTLWISANIRKIRQQLDDIISDMRLFPNRIRLYEPYTHLHDVVKALISGHSILNDLKTDALKERHWKSILTILKLNTSLRELTFGMLWENGIIEARKSLMEILAMAQGEMGLEVFLSQVRDRWTKQELELVLYRNRTRLIKGWESLYTALDEHMSGLALMKNSPYYYSVREFHEERKFWEDKLTNLRGLFDLLLHIQRRYIYLEGIFFETSDIKGRLPVEWARFRSVDGEFVTLMRRVTSRPYALEMLNVENIDRILDRLETVMNSIQRALGEYLSLQRDEFSRFYFLGDDDLLEILGNSGRTSTALSHVGKMFSALGSFKTKLEIAADGGSVEYIIAMVSKDNEEVTIRDAIIVRKNTSCLEWLRRLEDAMYATLRDQLKIAVQEVTISSLTIDRCDQSESIGINIPNWIYKYPNQVMMLSILISWSEAVSSALGEHDCKLRLNNVLRSIIHSLEKLSGYTMHNLTVTVRKKMEQLISEFVYERDILLGLIDQGVQKADDFRWLSRLRFKYSNNLDMVNDCLRISLANSTFSYGFEYLGIGERLVQTPLTDRCYLTLTQALHHRLGANPFGPAGTGKTETVKALGNQLGRFVVVMNCDERFDFSAMGRIFCGLCQVGAWGCFDEFNRLEERALSAVSQQILSIQRGLLDRRSSIELLGKTVRLHENVGIFVTLNPGYAGRRNLPDNLKNLFRSISMVVPDKRLIAQVLLFSKGFAGANFFAERVVKLFDLCNERMSKCSHYDFGLRALKAMLNNAGSLRRRMGNKVELIKADADESISEIPLIVEAIGNNILPIVVKDDLPVFSQILNEVFPGSGEIVTSDDKNLREHLALACAKNGLTNELEWSQKVSQLKQVIDMRNGVIVVGSVASGKTLAIRTLLETLEMMDGIRGDLYVMDPKAVDKKQLYGVLDSTTMEWSDGIFTQIVRQIILNQKGEMDRRHWIVFDGDIDPEWAENLNSVLDDNMILTLPNGERLNIPLNVRVIFEVDNLSHATPATVSRCGLLWLSDNTITDEMRLLHLFHSLELASGNINDACGHNCNMSFLDAVRPMIIPSTGASSLVSDVLDFAIKADHVMTPTRERLLISFEALLARGLKVISDYNEGHPDFPMEGDHMVLFARRWLLFSILWGFGGSCSLSTRKKLCEFVHASVTELIPNNFVGNLFDYRILETGEFEAWACSVPHIELDSHKVIDADMVIPTTDTTRHVDVIETYVMHRRPIILCGPAGSGKTMTLLSTLKSIEGVIVASLSFSSQTSPEIILKTFRQYCIFKKKGKELILEPSEGFGLNAWLIVFCDEINLPENDQYGTQRVISFMRQLIEHGGYWREDNQWVRISRIQFVGACNPPSDAGRVVMTPRFLRHAPLLYIDFPSKESLLQIYGTFNGGIMKLFPSLRTLTNPLTEAMVDLYSKIQDHFTSDMQPHYFFSPRELTRWIRGMYGALKQVDALERNDLVRLWAHEALRLFSDRLVEEFERKWCSEAIDEVARTHFVGVDFSKALARPLLYSSWLSNEIRSVTSEDLSEYIESRLRIFYEEELDIPLVICDDVLEHMLRIDRVLRQPFGHCLLIGDSGTGKTVLTKFVAWIQGMTIFQIKPHSKYSLEDFNEDLRTILRRVGADGEKICFIFDEASALSGGFLEAMNALLASGEVPGLFEGDHYAALLSVCRDNANREGNLAISEDELWRRFIFSVQRNLHIIFTMNPGGGQWKNKTRSSPALFNRCVVDWVGTWSSPMLGAVARQLTSTLDLDESTNIDRVTTELGRKIMDNVIDSFDDMNYDNLHLAITAAVVDIHNTSLVIADQTAQTSHSLSKIFISPRDFVVFINKLLMTMRQVRAEFEEQQLHVNAGISKFQQTQDNLAELKQNLNIKSVELTQKELLANEKLQQILKDQKEAEAQRDVVEKIGFEVETQERAIDVRKAEAQRQLDEAEPALLSAKSAVSSISKKDLDEVRNLLRPPINVQKTLECIAVMLGEKKTEWTDVRKMIGKIDFISSIINFDVGLLTPSQIKLVQQEYLDGNEELNYESVMRSSKACGPLYRWAESQVKYSVVQNRIQPLREEVDRLMMEAEVVKKKKTVIEMEVQQVEQSIEHYKVDYAGLIRDVQTLKAEMDAVTTKIKRAENLLTSFNTECERWSNIRDGFQYLKQTIVGDSLLISAFLTYSGFFDFRTRSSLLRSWMDILDAIGIQYKRDIDMVTSLSSAPERLKWQAQGLSTDSLSVENGVILKHHDRFPLIIDPSGQAINFILSANTEKRIQRTSFQDSAFLKTFTSSIRFGTALIIENIENIDPIIFPVLNREVHRTGGRSLIQVGPDEVDYSPTFSLVLYTKNPACNLLPEVCSKVTLINFTQTPASVQSQSLSLILQRLSPDIEDKRRSGMKLHSEKVARLRELETQMLSSINSISGNILDDDKVVEGMQMLSQEGSQLEDQLRSNSESMMRVEAELKKYEEMASISRKLFILLLSIREISFLYEFSAEYFIRILEKVLSNDGDRRIGGSDKLGILRKALFHEVAARCLRRMTSEDKLVFCLMMGRLVHGDDYRTDFSSVEEMTQHAHTSFGMDFLYDGRGITDLVTITGDDLSCKTPLLICSAPGFDVSNRIERLAVDEGRSLASIAMGSSECFSAAEAMLALATKNGSWVLLKNCHLCIQWLQDKALTQFSSFGNGIHENFRLFLTSEIHHTLPVSIVRYCDILVTEASTGLKASLLRLLSCINPARFKGAVRNRLYLLLVWLHAVFQERIRYIPNGWSEKYDFMESDIIYAVDVIDEFCTLSTKGRENIDPLNLPWIAMRTVLSKDIYGGRLNQEIDQQRLDYLVNSIFRPEAYDLNFKLGKDYDAPSLPEGNALDDYWSWIQALPTKTPPSWIGLDSAEEVQLSKAVAMSISSKVERIKYIFSEQDRG